MIARLEDGWKGLSGSSSAASIQVPAGAIRRKRVLITGAGGSIGSSLARVVAAHGPERMLLLDSSEQAIYQIDRTLNAPHTAILASVCDAAAIEEAFSRHKPQVVFHAAAFKHVPLMESHPFAAVENNTVGSFLLAKAAIRHGVAQLIFVSTDKAVDPAGIMGASKRVMELTALALATSATKIKAVRLGNVYGSQGSVAPLFQEQIAQGGPVTVTHPAATRYFLSLDRAAALLLFALTEELPSATLIPELGKPIRIEEIAQALVRQSNSQSQIVYTGLRPGEKLHERLFSNDESPLGEAGVPLRELHSRRISAEQAATVIAELQAAIRARNLERLLRTITQLVPSYHPGETVLAAQALTECRA